jgi:hypothetical protein
MGLNSYNHARADQTARALTSFSKSLMKLAALQPGQNCILRVEYDDAPHGTSDTEIIVFVERDDEVGHYFFNNVEIDDLNEAVHVWSMSCSGIIKQIASDEKREDSFEEIGEEAIPQSLQEIMDAYRSPTDDDDSEETVLHDRDEDIVSKFLRSSADADEEALDEPTIYEEYNGQTMELKPTVIDDPSDDEVLENVTEDEQSQHGVEAA